MRRTLILLGLSIAFLNSCRTLKHRTANVTRSTLDTTKPILPEIKNVVLNSFQFDYLSYKARCDYKDPNMDQPFTMNFRMKYDSIIWISITAVGFEVARARLDKDSIKIINRLEKNYLVYDYAYIKKLAGTPLSLVQVQYLLTANLLFPPESYVVTAESNKFKTTQGYIENSLTIDGKSRILEQILQHLVEKSNANVIYSDFKKVDKQQFPGKVDISALTPKKNLSLIMENSGISTDSIQAFPFDIPAKYEKGN